MFNNNFQNSSSTKMESFSPKSSPRRIQDSSGTLKTKISLGKNPSIVHSGPFYLLKESPEKSDLTGATNLISHYGLEHTYSKFNSKKVKEQLSSFLPTLPCVIDGPGVIENSSLRSVIDKPPIGGKELVPLTSVQLAGFRLHPNVPLPDKYRILNSAPTRKHKKKDKKHKYDNNIAQDLSTSEQPGDTHEKKHKKGKRHDDDKERKKRKKEKKRKKQSKHSPDHPSSPSAMET